MALKQAFPNHSVSKYLDGEQFTILKPKPVYNNTLAAKLEEARQRHEEHLIEKFEKAVIAATSVFDKAT